MSDELAQQAVSSTRDAPDWDARTDEVECFRCGYNLRGLTEPRCPECGLPFEWADVLDPERRRHPYLFEHHGQHHGIWSFGRTVGGALFPATFWRTLTMQHAFRPDRLWRFWWVGVAIYVVATVCMVEALEFVARSFGSLFPPDEFLEWLAVWCLAPILVQGASLGSLLVFQQTLASRRIRSFHIVRCAVYGGIVMQIGALASMLLCVGFALLDTVPGVPVGQTWIQIFATLILCVVGATLGAWWIALWQSYWRYLRIEKPFGMILASQIIAALVLINLCARVALW